MKTKRLWIIGSIVLVVLTLLAGTFGCAKSPETAAPAQTLKIGMIAWTGWPLGPDMYHAMQVRIDEDNAAGGLLIGGKKYQIELINYDSKNDPASATAAANRLIFEDKVKFIMGDLRQVNVIWPITEENKVIFLTGPTEPDPPSLAPSNHYTFDGWVDYVDAASFGWLHANYPDLKTFYSYHTDDESGHGSDATMQKCMNAFGFTQIGTQFVSATATDLSALGLKVAQSEADCYLVNGGGPALDGIALKGVYQAGYKGQAFGTRWFTAATLNALAGQDADEGLIGAAWPCEFDPATTEIAKKFKADYIAKWGKWDGPEIQGEVCYEILRAALVKAGSMDTTKVADVIASGLEFEGPQGAGKMVARPDLGNPTRTVCSVVAYPFKRIEGGQSIQIGSMTLDDAVKYYEQVWK